MEKWSVFQNVAKWFRLIEIFFAFLFLQWLYSKLPFVAKASAIFANRLVAIFTNPIFIFIIFNIILITLFIKSGQVAGDSVSGDNAKADLYQEITFYSTETFSLAPKEEIVYQDKEMINVVSEVKEEMLRESASDKTLGREEREDFVEVSAEAEEELSSEEFKRTIEDFIAKQMRFHKEEKLAIVAC